MPHETSPITIAIRAPLEQSFKRASNSRRPHPLRSHLAPIALEPHARSALALPKQATETYTAHTTAIPAAHSNKVYLPRMSPSHLANIAARQINAIR